MKRSGEPILTLPTSLAVLLASSASAFSATVIPITSFDPNTFFAGGVTAGIDFNDGGPTQAGFLGIPASNNTTYNVTTNGITFDIVVNNTNTGNQNRDRGTAPGDLIRDFEQWFNNSGTGVLVDAAINFSGLTPNTDYEISFFTYNAGAGQTTHSFYEGASISDPLITTFTTAGGPTNFSAWSPGITFGINSGANGEIDITVQSDVGGRLTMNGISVVAVPEPSSTLLGSLGLLALLRRRR